MPANEPNDALERLLDRTLRELPLRRAPPTLESRVLGALDRRAARPWWRRSFGHWPLLARAAFLVLCSALIRLASGNLAAALVPTQAPDWLYGIIAICAALYALLFGLGAAAYRTLYLQPRNGG